MGRNGGPPDRRWQILVRDLPRGPDPIFFGSLGPIFLVTRCFQVIGGHDLPRVGVVMLTVAVVTAVAPPSGKATFAEPSWPTCTRAPPSRRPNITQILLPAREPLRGRR